MSVEIFIVDGAIGSEVGLPREHLSLTREALCPGSCGAVLVFDGVVRELEEGRRLAALEYETYEPMALTELKRLAVDVVAKHGLIGLQCTHSRGRVGVGECSMRVVVWSKHRAEGLAAMGEFIERLKKDVPIWKKAMWA